MRILKAAFDIGNVLFTVDLDKFFDFLIQREITDNKITAHKMLSRIQTSQDCGFCDIKQGFWYVPEKHLDYLQEAWLSTLKPVKPMIKVLEEALGKGFDIALLSNMGFDHVALLRREYNFVGKCRQYFSCELGVRKPSKLFYQGVLADSGWPRDVIFFDDRVENIEGAEGYFLGKHFNVEEFQSEEEAADQAREFLML